MTFIAFGVTATTVAVAGVAVGGYTAYQAGKSEEAMAEYSSDIAKNEAVAQEQAIEAEARRLTKDQRGAKARARVNVAGRGGLAEGTDLLALAEQSRDMQLDQLELQRQKDIAGVHGQSQMDMYDFQGKQARSPYRWISGGVKGGITGYALGSSLSKGGKTPKGPKGNDGFTAMSDAPAGVKAKYGWK